MIGARLIAFRTRRFLDALNAARHTAPRARGRENRGTDRPRRCRRRRAILESSKRYDHRRGEVFQIGGLREQGLRRRDNEESRRRALGRTKDKGRRAVMVGRRVGGSVPMQCILFETHRVLMATTSEQRGERDGRGGF
ncbi:hypothetical protein EXIGLDRAFT_312958 [Exidia glandulosa HHB12029]|uniref:Uncharacterized protein n=1 Tax=Exidia glandulosa HHB12029 TaxID=1314781 RepID=A0A165LT18_EXIGL|nr:hypothetical protein EXIGLDRAFT_312958 [Exidia glandulosa HHB12029]